MAPATPQITVAVSGTTATVSITGAAGAVHQLYYRKEAETDWTAGATRTGDGDLSASGLDASTGYWFMVVSTVGGEDSLPSASLFGRTDASSRRVFEIISVGNLDERSGEVEVMVAETGRET